MWQIFGDTNDITFWWDSTSQKMIERTQRPALPRTREIQRLDTPPTHESLAPPPTPVQRSHTSERRTSSYVPSQPPVPRQIEGWLKKLIESMKPSFFPQGNDASLRMAILSSSDRIDPLILMRGAEGSLLFGTGFSDILKAGRLYPSFPDMRLPYSEKDRLVGWILLVPGFDMASFQMILEVLWFPHVYATRDVIAYIRENITDPNFLDKCRFFEIFSPGTTERKIGDFLIEDYESSIAISLGSDSLYLSLGRASQNHRHILSLTTEGDKYLLKGSSDTIVLPGEILTIDKNQVSRHTLRFTFDTFYRDKNSVGVLAGYTLSDREMLAENGVLTFVLEEDIRARAIVWHIFIDSRGFVHSQEMMIVHKEVLKGIRHTYEQAILANPRIERSELVHTLRRELTKYCYLLTWRTPVVLPIIIER